ncbi:MAG TPA: hypothetical protein ENJ27_01940, partial [Candidatus Moranbacteria bacterium]|nr:hypothetical protein [Candidatus Moranbacteria bacterium]
MKILHINTLDTKGGASRVAYDLKNELKKRGHSSWIFVCKKFSKDNDVFYIAKDNFVEKIFRKITKRDLGLMLRNRITKFFPTDIDFFNDRGLFKSSQYKQTDIIHCHNLHSNFFNLKNLIKISEEKPVIWTLHDMWAITAQCPHAFG